MRRLAIFCLLLGYLLCGCGQNAAAPTEPFRLLSRGPALSQRHWPDPKHPPAPPHHRSDRAASPAGRGPHRRRLRSGLRPGIPADHYPQPRSLWAELNAFAVAIRNFQTVMGEVAIDAAAVDRLRENPLVSASNLFPTNMASGRSCRLWRIIFPGPGSWPWRYTGTASPPSGIRWPKPWPLS